MDFTSYLIIGLGCALTMVLCRTVPLLALKGRELPESLSRALGFIAPAAFAALIANDLISPSSIAAGFSWTWAAPLLASVVVAAVGVKTKSMAACIIVGVAVLAVLMWCTGIL